jgi:hypothetical protein
MLRTVALIALLGCSKGGEGPPATTTEAPPPKAAPAPAKRKPMRVTRMSVTGFLRITENGVSREEQLPKSPLRHGEFPEGCWVTPDNTLYAVGKQYTGVDGPDVGVVYKRTPAGEWSTAFRLEGREFHSITGRSAKDIVVGLGNGYVTFDGTAWTLHDLKEGQLHAWSDGKRLLLQDFDGTKLWEVTSSGVKPVAMVEHDAYDERYVCARGGTSYKLFDKSVEIGEDDLSPAEEAEINAELKEIQEHPERIRPVK